MTALAAKQEYVDLKRELSRISRKSSIHANSLEEGNATSNEFNLDEFLNGLRDEHASAGHLPKNLGISWKNLTVKVGLVKIKTTFQTSSSLNRGKQRMLILSLPSLPFFNSGRCLAWVSARTKR